MEKINWHGPYTQDREKMLFCGYESTDRKHHQERDSITPKAYQHTGSRSQSHILVGITPVKDVGCNVDAADSNTCKKESQKTCKSCCKRLPAFPDGFKPVFLKIISCQEKRIEKQCPRNTEEVSKLCETDQQSGSNGNENIAWDFADIRCGNSPKKQCHEIPEREFRTIQVKSGIFMNDTHIQEIVKHLIYQIRDDKLLYQFFKGHFLF